MWMLGLSLGLEAQGPWLDLGLAACSMSLELEI